MTNAVSRSKPMKLRMLIALAVATASFCPPSEAEISGLTPGTVISWGEQVIPYTQPGTRYQAIAAGAGHSLALKSDGTVAAWGYNAFGESTVPASLTGFVDVAAGKDHSLARTPDEPGDARGYNDGCERTATASVGG